MTKAQILYKPFDAAPDRLAELLDDGITVNWGDPLELGGGDFEVLVAGRPSLEQLKHSPALECLVIPFAGIPAETRALLLNHFPDLPVYNLHHNAQATAEMALALLFAVAKNLIPADRALRDFDWRIRYAPNQNLILANRRVTVLGYGAVGRRIAGMCQALGMQVRALQRSQPTNITEAGTPIHTLEDLDTLIRETDVLFIALPLTPETHGLISRERLEGLSADSILINVARAAIVDEAALYSLLLEGAIAGAGLDVWYRYPEDEASRAHTPPSDFPFHELGNVVMSPHRGGGSRENESFRLEHLARLLNTLARGKTPETRVNLVEGY